MSYCADAANGFFQTIRILFTLAENNISRESPRIFFFKSLEIGIQAQELLQIKVWT